MDSIESQNPKQKTHGTSNASEPLAEIKAGPGTRSSAHGCAAGGGPEGCDREVRAKSSNFHFRPLFIHILPQLEDTKQQPQTFCYIFLETSQFDTFASAPSRPPPPT